MVKAGTLLVLFDENGDHGKKGIPTGTGATEEMGREKERMRNALAFPSSTSASCWLSSSGSQRARDPWKCSS